MLCGDSFWQLQFIHYWSNVPRVVWGSEEASWSDWEKASWKPQQQTIANCTVKRHVKGLNRGGFLVAFYLALVWLMINLHLCVEIFWHKLLFSLMFGRCFWRKHRKKDGPTFILRAPGMTKLRTPQKCSIRGWKFHRRRNSRTGIYFFFDWEPKYLPDQNGFRAAEFTIAQGLPALSVQRTCAPNHPGQLICLMKLLRWSQPRKSNNLCRFLCRFFSFIQKQEFLRPIV